MSTWQSIPTLVGTGRDAVHRFADAIGLSESELRQSDWEDIPFLAPEDAPNSERNFDWKQHTYSVYRVRTTARDLWLFWFAIRGWTPGNFIPMQPEVVATWQRPDPRTVTSCSYARCQNPALEWLGPAIALQLSIDEYTHTLAFYGCSKGHQEALRQTGRIKVLLQGPEQAGATSRTLAADTIVRLFPDVSKRGEHSMSTSLKDERAGRLVGCPFDQWVFDVASHWREDDIAILETMLRARLQEHYDYFGEHGRGFWQLRVNYPRTRYTAVSVGGSFFEAESAQGLADEITEDYAALRATWRTAPAEKKETQA